jgi:hypothetical protein
MAANYSYRMHIQSTTISNNMDAKYPTNCSIHTIPRDIQQRGTLLKVNQDLTRKT